MFQTDDIIATKPTSIRVGPEKIENLQRVLYSKRVRIAYLKVNLKPNILHNTYVRQNSIVTYIPLLYRNNCKRTTVMGTNYYY